jgi:hypothetical protein
MIFAPKRPPERTLVTHKKEVFASEKETKMT